MPTLYAVYGERNLNANIISHANVGYTSKTVEERLSDSDYSRKAAGGLWKVIHTWDIPDQATESKVHRLLEESYARTKDTSNTEEFLFNLPSEQIKRVVGTLLNQALTSVSRPNAFGMREHQQECHDKAVKALTDLNFDKFLIGAVMRFGKTFTAYQIMRSLNVDTTLIITSKPNDVRGAWRAELEDHVDFADYTFYDIRDCTQDIAKIPGKKVIFTSVQYLQNTTGAVNKDWVYDLNIDLLMFDEEHHGSKTEDAKNILERLNPSKTLAISGTPYKAYARGLYPEECIYRWDTFELPMQTYCINLHKDILSLSENTGFVDENGFNINKFFAATEEGFVFHSMVEDAMQKIFGVSPFEFNKEIFSPRHIRGVDQRCLEHILIRMESVNTCNAMEKMLSRMLPKYTVINAAGSDSGVVKNGATLQRLIKNSNRSITITCGRFETGITVPKIGAVFALHGGSSPESYYQTAARSSSNYEDGDWKKKAFYLFDFDPSRALELTYTKTRIMKAEGYSMKLALDDYFKCANIYIVDGNTFQTIDSTKIVEHFNDVVCRRDPSAEISSEYGMNKLKLNASTMQALIGISSAKAKKLAVALTENNMAKGKIAKTEPRKLSKEEKKQAKDLIEKMKTVCRRIPIVVITKEYTDLANLLDSESDSWYFKEVTGIDLSDYKDMVDSGALDYEWQDRSIIRIFNNFQNITPEFN